MSVDIVRENCISCKHCLNGSLGNCEINEKADCSKYTWCKKHVIGSQYSPPCPICNRPMTFDVVGDDGDNNHNHHHNHGTLTCSSHGLIFDLKIPYKKMGLLFLRDVCIKSFWLADPSFLKYE